MPEATRPVWQNSGMAWQGRLTIGDEAVGLHQVPEVVDDVLQVDRLEAASSSIVHGRTSDPKVPTHACWQVPCQYKYSWSCLSRSSASYLR